MEEKRYVCNEPGVCPVCGHRSLSWGASECNGDYMSYEWECDKCHTQGTEWYKLVFDGHDVDIKTEATEDSNKYKCENVNDYILPEA